MYRDLCAAKLSKLIWLAAAVMVIMIGAACPLMADYSTWHYSVNIDVSSGAFARTDAPVELPVNFTKWLASAGGSGKTLDLNSIRVAEYSDVARTTLVAEKASQFDRTGDFDAKTYAAGEVVWLLDGNTTAATTRYFTIYYDVTENGAKTAPSYTTNLIWDQSARTLENGSYKATYSADKGGIIRLDNKTSGSSKIMWNADQRDWWAMGQWHTINEDGTGWIDSFGGAATAVNSVVAGPVRVTVTSTRNEGRVNWTMVRKYYAGTRSVDYWKASVTAEKNPGSPGSGRVWLKRIGWDDFGAPVIRTLVPPTNFGGWTLYDKVFEYGSDGGVGIASSSNFVMDSSEEINQTPGHVASQGQFDCWGLSWKIRPYPIIMDYAFVVHNGTTEIDADVAMTTALNDYNSPVTAVVNSTATVSGIITDSSTGAAIRGAVVRINAGTFSATAYSSATGFYSLADVPVGSAVFSVKADHYSYYSAGATLVAGQNTQNAALTTAPFIDLRTAAVPSVNWLLGTDSLTWGPVNPPYDDFSAPSADESGFLTTTVPADWDGQQGLTNDIYGWYRTHITVPSEWAGKNLRLRDMLCDDVDAAYFNGVKIGQTGSFPDPINDLRNANGTAVLNWSGTRDYWIAPSSVSFGASNVIAVRVFDDLNGGGISGGEPKLEVAPSAASVSGVVIGPAGPVAGASLYIPWIGTVTTDSSGHYSFPFLVGDIYQLTVSAYGYKTKKLTVDVPDTGAVALDISLEAAATISGTILRTGGTPLQHCRIMWEGPVSGSMLTGADGKYTFTAPPGVYSIVYNALNVVPQTVNITTSTAPITRNVVLEWGMTPVYDAFSGNTLDMTKWDFGNMAKIEGAPDPVPTVSNGVLNLEMAPERGGIISKTYFPKVCTHELIWARPYVGTNQILNLYGGTGTFGNFVEFGHENYKDGKPLLHVWGCLGYWEGTADSSWPVPIAVVRSGQYYDFYANGKWAYSGVSNGITDQSRMYLYGFEGGGGNTIGYYSAVCAGTPIAPATMSLEAARSAASGTPVSIAGATVSASFADAFWVESNDRANGMKVLSTANPGAGRSVSLIGRVVRIDGEVVLQAVSVTDIDSATIPDPIAINNRTAAIMDPIGASAQGMRVKIFGTCTAHIYDLNTGDVLGFFINDGTGLPGDGTNKGIYVPANPEWLYAGYTPPAPPAYIGVTGVLTVDRSTGSAIPSVRVQNYTDIQDYTSIR